MLMNVCTIKAAAELATEVAASCLAAGDLGEFVEAMRELVRLDPSAIKGSEALVLEADGWDCPASRVWCAVGAGSPADPDLLMHRLLRSGTPTGDPALLELFDGSRVRWTDGRWFEVE